MAIRKQTRSRANKRPSESADRCMPPREFWEEMMALFDTIPEEVRARMPRDGARNFDHYLDGTSRQD